MVADPLAAPMMALAGIAYGRGIDIARYLSLHPSTAAEWEVAWLAIEQDPPVHFAYIARNKESGAHAVAIRGTYPDPLSSAYWSDAGFDSPFGGLVPWPYREAPSPAATISRGTLSALQGLLPLTDAGGTTLQAALSALPPNTPLYITGHSLGGTLAPVLALWSADALGRPLAGVYSFAGMTPGNRGFAALFAGPIPLSGRIWRYENTLDTVPYGWNRVLRTRNFYQPAPQGGWLVSLLVWITALRLLPFRYAPVGEAVKLTGVLSQETFPVALIGYLIENLHQHLPDTYLALLGAAPLPFSLGFGAILLDRDAPAVADRHKTRAGFDVFFVRTTAAG